MNHPSLGSLGRFLYTQNPFYLISCFLIIYGLQIGAASYGGDFFLRSVFLTFSLVAYTALMVVTAIGVIRLGKVWQDARSILLVVVIGQVALSVGLDEYCVIDWTMASGMLLFGAVFSIASTELILRACRMRLPGWYRACFYSLLICFFLVPIALGYAVRENHLRLANWGGPLFSTLVSAALLLLAPAVRRGSSYVRDNGTPWNWPLYPLSAFVILSVVAIIRSHAIWMSFGFLGSPVQFEPFLLMPILLAVLVLIVQSDPGGVSDRTYGAMCFAPAMLACSFSGGGQTNLPIHADLAQYFGSAPTIALVLISLFYVYVGVRGAKYAQVGFVSSLIVLSSFAPLPLVAVEVGFQRWMIAAFASIVLLINCLRESTDRNWFALAVSLVVSVAVAGYEHERYLDATLAGSIVALIALMLIGAYFQTQFATLLRWTAGISLAVAGAAVFVWHLQQLPGIVTYAAIAGMSIMSIAYMFVVRRAGWMVVFGWQLLCLVGLVSHDGIESGSINQTSWPIPSGLLCFAIGLTITSIKSGLHRSCITDKRRRLRFQKGL